MKLDCLFRELVPGRGNLDLVLLEKVLAIKHGDRSAVPGHAEKLSAGARLIERPRCEFGAHSVGANWTEIRKSFDLAKAANELELHMRNVREAASRLESRAQLGVVWATLPSID